MAEVPPHSTYFTGAHNFRIDQQTINSIAGNQYILNIRLGEELTRRLDPILDASHTRNRKKSPPDSECFPGTREVPIREITIWANSTVSLAVFPNAVVHHIYWLHGFAGCGKSAISLEVSKIYAGSGRLLASYFFLRGLGDRSTMQRFAVTLASQLVATLPATAPFIEAAVTAEPGLLTGHLSLAMQLDRLVLGPFQAALDQPIIGETLAKGPFLIVIDGLDECEDKQEVEELIDHLLDFFNHHPSIPLRIFIASRVEQHIRERLEVDVVKMCNLDSHSPHEDLEKFLWASFHAAAKRDRVIRAYVQTHGDWPTKPDVDKLISHIGGSFVLASTLFKYIIQPATERDPTTPMERLPLTLRMNGLDDLYSQILARSQHLSHFRAVISTIALLYQPISVAGIADLLNIEIFEVIRVLLNLQAIIHLPGTDKEGLVTVCHTSLRDFLTTERRSGDFFVTPSFHLYLSYSCISCPFENPEMSHGSASHYGVQCFSAHWRSFVESDSCNMISEIEQFQVLPISRPAYPTHAFLCNMSLYSLLLQESSLSRTPAGILYLLTQCSAQLALASEFPDPRIRLWLEAPSVCGFRNIVDMLQFTEDMYEIVRHNLERAANALRLRFPDVLEHHPTSTGAVIQHDVDFASMSGIQCFKALEWMVARAQFKWEEANITPRPPLGLSITKGIFLTVTFSFDIAT